MEKKKLGRRILLGILALVLAALAVLAVVFFRYYPHYRTEKEAITVTPAGENRMMSCNLRYINPFDLGERSWFRRADLIEKMLEYFEQYYEVFLQTEDLSALEKEYDSMLVNLHKKVRVLDSKEPFEGTAMGITKKGELVVDTWSSRKLVSSGEVSVRGIYGYV